MPPAKPPIAAIEIGANENGAGAEAPTPFTANIAAVPAAAAPAITGPWLALVRPCVRA